MPIYVYETIPKKAGEKPTVHEILQGMSDAPLTTHPETGEPIRRVILGGFGVLSSTGGRTSRRAGGSSDCGPGCCCG